MRLRMTVKELRQACKELYGEAAYGASLARDLGVDAGTASRWLNGVTPVPSPAVAALRCFLETKKLPPN